MKFTEEEMEAYFYGPTPEDWPMKCAAMFEQMRAERDSRTSEIREYLRQCELNAEDNIEGTTANEFLEWNAVAGALHDILRKFDKRWPKR